LSGAGRTAGTEEAKNDMTSTDAGMTDIEAMTLEAVQAELGAYRPSTQASVVSTAEWLAHRMRLWRRLDELSGVRKPA
jgi:hypothetical protein